MTKQKKNSSDENQCERPMKHIARSERFDANSLERRFAIGKLAALYRTKMERKGEWKKTSEINLNEMK